jgi:hypothetical protein
MRPLSKLWWIVAPILALLACSPLRLISPTQAVVPTNSPPAAADTATPLASPTTLTVNTPIPTFTLAPTLTRAPTSTPVVTYDQSVKASRIRFDPNGTWMEITDSIPANDSKRYVLSAMQGQVMGVSILQGPAYSVHVAGVDNTLLNDPRYPLPFWRGVLPSTQDYLVTIESQVSGPFTLRIAINPLGQAVQNFGFVDPQYAVSLRYTDEFAPTDVPIPIYIKGTPLLTLGFIDPTFYSPRTNLSEAYLVLAASVDPAVVSTCTQPSSQFAEAVTGQVNINSYTFTRSEFTGAAAGNRYDQVTYRTVWEGKCFEVVFLIHSTNIGNYTPGTVVEYDRPLLLGKFESVLSSFIAH